jgi:hypothetical protein
MTVSNLWETNVTVEGPKSVCGDWYLQVMQIS